MNPSSGTRSVQRVFFHTEVDEALADITDPVTPDVLRRLEGELR